MSTQMEDRLFRRGPMLSLMPVTMENPGGDRSHSGPATSFLESLGSDMNTKTMPRWSDRRRQIAGRIYAMCSDQQKAIALAQGWTEGWVSKVVHGNPAAAGYLLQVEKMQRSAKTEAGPLAAAPLAEMARVVAETFSAQELEDAEDFLLELESRREARENESTIRLLAAARRRSAHHDEIARLEDELAQRHVEEIATSLLLVAVLWERSRRRAERVH